MNSTKISTSVRTSIIYLIFIFSLALTGCTNPTPLVTSGEHYNQVLQIKLVGTETQEDIEALYNAKVLVWHPKVHFAIVGSYNSSNLLSQGAARNHNNFRVREFSHKHGKIVGADPFWAWAGGWNSSTFNNLETTLEVNQVTWQQINLVKAQKLAPDLGENVKVAVIDTGIDIEHEAFKNRLAPENEWYDFVDNDSLPQEQPSSDSTHNAYGHGTGVAGIIIQIAPHVTILPIRVLNPEGVGDLSSVVLAVDWAIEHNAQIINLSLGSTAPYRSLETVLSYAHSKGVIVVASVGNSGRHLLEYPAKYNDLVSNVSSTDGNDALSSFSNFGNDLEFSAPGENLFTVAPENRIASWTGTSFATPVLAGSIALALSENSTLGADRIEELLIESAHDLTENEPAKIKYLGYGRLDSGEFMSLVRKK